MADNIYKYEAKDLSGKTVKLSDYKGKVLMIVNIASQCGQTPQLATLEKLYQKYRSQGFEILAFPSNQFANQQPEDGAAIQDFCSANYGTSFKIFAKGDVKGKRAQPLYNYLAQNSKVLGIDNYPLWNFQKYIIDRNGKVAGWFIPWKYPDNDKITDRIENCLNTTPVEN
jgi:glutathione peroxidase